MIQINDKCFYNEIDNCLESYNTNSLLEALNSLFDLNIDSNKSVMNILYLRVVLTSGEEYFAKGFTEILALFKKQFKIPIVDEGSYYHISNNWVIKLDNKYKEAYDSHLKSIMIESKPTIKAKRITRRKKSNANNLETN